MLTPVVQTEQPGPRQGHRPPVCGPGQPGERGQVPACGPRGGGRGGGGRARQPIQGPGQTRVGAGEDQVGALLV